MNKNNVFKSSNFYMAKGDILHMLIIDEGGVVVNIELGVGGQESSVPDAPTALSASDITTSSFVANWYFNERTDGYYLDMATDSAFTAMVAGYDNLDVGNVNEYSVVGLNEYFRYYYRVRAYNDIGTSIDSNSENLITTHTAKNDLYLPSKDELAEMYNELHLHGVGGFSSDVSGYFCSSESSAAAVWDQRFSDGAQNLSIKGVARNIRAIRSFTSPIVYSLRDMGPATGYIFYIVDIGGGLYTYYEAAPSDITAYEWSNIYGIAVGTTGTAIGTGQANTTAIISQAGHIDSAAKHCNDLVI